MAPPNHLKPERLELDPKDTNSSRIFSHWLRTFTNYCNALDANQSKLDCLINFIGPTPYAIIETKETYDDAVAALKTAYTDTVNPVFARHILITRKQEPNEPLDVYLRNLKALAKDCSFTNVTAQIYQDEYVRDSFINGLRSNYIRQRLLEVDKLDLDTAFKNARALEVAQKSSESYQNPVPSCATTDTKRCNSDSDQTQPSTAAAFRSTRPYSNRSQSTQGFTPPFQSNSRCYYCGGRYHERSKCPASGQRCMKCRRFGHFEKVCQSNPVPSKFTAAAVQEDSSEMGQSSQNSTFQEKDQSSNNAFPTSWPPLWATTPPSLVPIYSVSSSLAYTQSYHPLRQSMTGVTLNDQNVKAVADSASSYSYLSPEIVKWLKAPIIKNTEKIGMASGKLTTESIGSCIITLKVQDRIYPEFKFRILPDLCADVLLGLDFLSLHRSITLNYGGSHPPLTICGLSTLKVPPPSLFAYLTPNCKPIADSRRRYSLEDQEFIEKETKRMLNEGIIEPSNSPWRAQIVVVKKGEKKRLAVDYSQTINLYTKLDAYPLPLISDLINKIAQYRIFSTVDAKSAYHQIAIADEDKHYTAFEANGRLFHFNRVPFGVTNGVSVFQREMDRMVDEYSLQGTFPYLDNLTICGRTQEEHDYNLAKFQAAAKKINLTYNESKCVFNTRKLSLLGCVIENGEIRPDPERMKSLDALPVPTNLKSLKRCLGFFSYYSKWIPNFSDKIRPLNQTTSFPMSVEAVDAMNQMKHDIKSSVVCCIDETLPFTVETDASDHSLAATLNQQGRPVAFFTRSLQSHELINPSIEKEAMAIIEAIRHWRHFLATRRFTLVTDQRSVSFMFSKSQRSKIKNDKILRWRMELSTFNYDIKYRPGNENQSPDALSRICASSSGIDLKTIHNDLCHPGVTRFLHYVKARNLPFSVDEVRSVVRNCQACAECKPNFYKPPVSAHLIKATHPLERLNLDFKGPLPSSNNNKFFLNAVDEYSRFVWVFPCTDVSASTVIKCLTQIFTTFGLPEYIHSDRGSAFLSTELLEFLSSLGIAASRTTPYNPAGNGQVEVENRSVWKAITLALKSKNLPINQWQEVLPQVLHSLRSLLCTSTNATPHDRIFTYPRRSTTGVSLPEWLSKPGLVLLRKHARTHKTDPLVECVELLHANPNYAFIRRENGEEKTVSLRDLAPSGENLQTSEVIVPLVESENPATPLPEPQPQQIFHESTTTSVSAEKPDMKTPPDEKEADKDIQSPVMVQHGGPWCKVDSKNILPTRLRKK